MPTWLVSKMEHIVIVGVYIQPHCWRGCIQKPMARLLGLYRLQFATGAHRRGLIQIHDITCFSDL